MYIFTPMIKAKCTHLDRPVLSMVTTMQDEAFAKIPDGTNLILH